MQQAYIAQNTTAQSIRTKLSRDNLHNYRLSYMQYNSCREVASERRHLELYNESFRRAKLGALKIIDNFLEERNFPIVIAITEDEGLQKKLHEYGFQAVSRIESERIN